jgi:hypothetical protein
LPNLKQSLILVEENHLGKIPFSFVEHPKGIAGERRCSLLEKTFVLPPKKRNSQPL